MTLLATVLREWLTPERFVRVPEDDLVMDTDDAVQAFVRAAAPNGVLAGVYAFFREQAGRMIRPGDRVLDIGSGPAALLTTIALNHPQAQFIGVDLSPAMTAAGRRTAAAAGATNVDLRLDDMTTLASIPTASVDVIFSSMALHHLPDTAALARCMAAMERVLAPGGRVFIADSGRIRSLKSVEYFVRRAIPRGEQVLEHDYRASLRAAFSPQELDRALPTGLGKRLSLYATAISPIMMVLMSPYADTSTPARKLSPMPLARRADRAQLRLFFRLGGMPLK